MLLSPSFPPPMCKHHWRHPAQGMSATAAAIVHTGSREVQRVDNDFSMIIIRLTLSLCAGSLIGLERTVHGRPAGIRTHSLVCLSSSLLMILAIFQWDLVADAPLSTLRVDPTRMAQGIMTGIGFLGAGVILKESHTIRGLTTAASIWLTAAVGIVIGMGLYFAAFLALLLGLAVLIMFRQIERFIPTNRYGSLTVSFSRLNHLSEPDLCKLISEHEIRCFDVSYHLGGDGKRIQYNMAINTMNPDNYRRLVETLAGMEIVEEFALKASR
jgi:putative Mg2+ transporter-C (MgtC) family protein